MAVGFIWFGTGPVAGSCEHGNEASSSIKVCSFVDYQSVRRTLLHVS
jgi:hypothetical protein